MKKHSHYTQKGTSPHSKMATVPIFGTGNRVRFRLCEWVIRAKRTCVGRKKAFYLRHIRCYVHNAVVARWEISTNNWEVSTNKQTKLDELIHRAQISQMRNNGQVMPQVQMKHNQHLQTFFLLSYKLHSNSTNMFNLLHRKYLFSLKRTTQNATGQVFTFSNRDMKFNKLQQSFFGFHLCHKQLLWSKNQFQSFFFTVRVIASGQW